MTLPELKDSDQESSLPTVEVPEPTLVSPKRRRKLLIIGIVIGCVIVIGAVLVAIGSSPATGMVHEPSTQSIVAQEVPLAPKTYHDQYLSFQYPGTYHVVPAQNDPAAYLDAATWTGATSSTELAVTVTPAVPFADVTGAHFRLSQPNVYQRADINTSTESGYVFTSFANGFEKTALIMHDNILVSIALTDHSGNDLSSDFNQIFGSITWQ